MTAHRSWIAAAFVVACALGLRAGQQQSSPASTAANLQLVHDQVAQRLGFEAFTLQDLQVVQDGDELTAAVRLADQPVTLELVLHSLRSPTFQVLVQQDASGALTPVEPPPISTYDGRVAELAGSRVAASYRDGLLKAIIQTDDERFVIEPAAKLDVEGAGPLHVVYRAADQPESGRTCGVTAEDEAKAMALAEQIRAQGGERRAAGTITQVAELGIAGDYSYYLEEGSSVAEAVELIETTINGVRLAYEVPAINLTFEITVIVIHTDSNDPYSSNNAGVLLDQFQAAWNAAPYNSIPRDCAQLFTGINLLPPPIGIANLNSGCNTSLAYSVIEINSVAGGNQKLALSAHELGHIWGAQHCDGCANCASCCRIMCSGLGGCTGILTSFGCFSESQIGNFVNNANCLIDLPPPESVPFCEDWASPTIATARWLYNKGGIISGSATNPPSTPFVIELDAAGGNPVQADELRSNYIDTSGLSNVVFSYFTQHKGVESGEDLVIEVRMSSKAWFEINRITSNGVDQNQFVYHSHVLPAGAYHPDFRLRFRTEVDGGSDNWFVDDISLDCFAPPVCAEPCDDGDACTVNDECVSEFSCLGQAVDCSGAGGECDVASCDPIAAEGNCSILTAIPDGGACSGGSGFCSGGTCVSASTTGRIFLAGDGQQSAVPSGGPTDLLMGAGSTVRVGVFLDENSPPGQLLNAYQVILPDQATLLEDAFGTVSYVDGGLPGTGDSVLLDKARPDWVFASQPAAQVVDPNYNESPTLGIFGLFFALPDQSTGIDPSTLTGIRYLGEFDLQASVDAVGQFELRFNVAPADPPHTQLFKPFGPPYSIEQLQPLHITVGIFDCLDAGDCGDLDEDGMRDDPCLWYGCTVGVCSTQPRGQGNGGQYGQADMGSPVGPNLCNVDGVADGNDRFHALNCFSDSNFGSPGGYPCETSTPSAINIDAGSSASCVLDGVCDGNDAFHALNSFANANFGNPGGYPCTCSGPAPSAAPVQPDESTGLVLRAPDSALPGDVVEVEVYLGGDLRALRGYQLHLAAGGGQGGALELVDIFVNEQRRDYAYAGVGGTWSAFNRSVSQMVVGMDALSGAPVRAGAYLATYVYRIPKNAAGTFVVEVLHDENRQSLTQRTFLFGRAAVPIAVSSAASVHISVAQRGAPDTRVGKRQQRRTAD